MSRREHWLAPPCPSHKVVFRTRAQALGALARCRRRARVDALRCERAVYKCPRCKYWHLTSQHGDVRGRARPSGRFSGASPATARR
jgi:hypothetical protein